YQIREMMFGYRDEFPYFECSQCGCLQIAKIPFDIAKYYPKKYYSFQLVDDHPRERAKMLAKKLRCRYAVYGRGLIGRTIWRMFPSAVALKSLRKLDIGESCRILDVGCGSGHLLYELHTAGFRNVLGIDPYIDRDIHYRNGVTILKRTIHEVGSGWDLVMFHHSFEHIADPLETLRHCSKILTLNGCCLIRIPTVSSYAWRRYGANWVQLDAPRHFFLYSISSLKILAARAGLRLHDVIYDSTEFQFWASEQYVQDIPLTSERSYLNNPSNSIFSSSQIECFWQQANLLNVQKDGDQAAFYLRKLIDL
ncbi:MAG: class I SAM-dependent methyltransferase, partial [Ktedonobacteraceae bacterium]